MTANSQTPTRNPAGISTDPPYGPLAFFGQPNPFMYQTIADDFFGTFANDELFVTQASGTGAAVANTPGDGGQLLLTAGTTANLSSGVKGVANNFFLPPAAAPNNTGLTSTLFADKKVFFLARMAFQTITGASATIGLVPSTYAAGNPTDGIVIQIGTNGTVCNLNCYSGSVLLWSVPFPSILLAGGANAVLAANSWFDIGFFVTRKLNVYGMLGFPLVGWVPQSAWSGVNNVNAQPPPKAQVCAYQVGVSGSWTPTAVGLTPTVTTFGSGLLANLDFILAAKER